MRWRPRSIRTNGKGHRATPPPRRKVVLVVEDSASVGGLIPALLREEGYRAVRASDVQEAVRLARGRRPDLMLLDLSLPVHSDLQMLHDLRGSDATRDIKMVVVVGPAISVGTDVQELVSDVVKKPFDIDVMLNAVRRALGDPEVEVQPRANDAQDTFLHGY